MIIHDANNPRAVANRAELERRLPDLAGAPDLSVVIGGDGFMLQTCAEHGLHPTYLGLNAGNLGFLLNDIDDWDRVADRIARRAFRVWEVPLLEAKITLTDGSIVYDRAINDVYMERMTGQTAHLSLTLDGRMAVEKLVADGVILSTALGSTAYAFSAGGPACHPAVRTLLVTAICPHMPRLPPLVLPETARVCVEVQNPEKRPVRAVADGRDVPGVKRVELGLAAAHIRIAWFEDQDATARMIRKLVHSAK